MFQGCIVALVTPMLASGALDEDSVRSLIEKHIEAGINGIVVCGSTGEAPTLTKEETYRLIQLAVETAKGRIPIIAGTGTYSTADTIARTAEAKKLGAAACLINVPYYNRPTQEGIFQHFSAVANAVSIPIILYNNPVRMGVDMLPETVERLSHIPNIIALKECADLGRVKTLLANCEPNFLLFSGVDDNGLAFILQGGKGVISVTANVAPKTMCEMINAALAMDFRTAGEINTKLMPLHKALGLESNPIPVKWAAQQLGWIKEGIRLPLTPFSQQHHEALKEAMKISGVI